MSRYVTVYPRNEPRDKQDEYYTKSRLILLILFSPCDAYVLENVYMPDSYIEKCHGLLPGKRSCTEFVVFCWHKVCRMEL